MKLYFTPRLCSLASHIIARESGLDVEFVKVAYKSKRTADGTDYLAINPLGYVPALVPDDGHPMTETPAILQYLADLVPERGLVAAPGTRDRYRAIAHLHILGGEVHKRVGPLLDARCDESFRADVRGKIASRLAFLDAELGEHPFFGGEIFTIVDAYAFAILGGLRDFCGIDIAPHPRLVALYDRVAQRPSAIEAIRFEGPLDMT